VASPAASTGHNAPHQRNSQESGLASRQDGHNAPVQQRVGRVRPEAGEEMMAEPDDEAPEARGGDEAPEARVGDDNGGEEGS
jgi:hypothetical protein